MSDSDRVATVTSIPARLPHYGDAHIPPGVYDACLAGCETWARCHGWAPRLVMVWSIVTMGYVGVAIPAYYRVARLDGRPRRNGRFLVGTRSRLYRDLARMLMRRPPRDGVPLDELVERLYCVVVRDVETDRDDHPIGGAVYSVIDWIQGPA